MYLAFKNEAKSIQTAGDNCARMVNMNADKVFHDREKEK